MERHSTDASSASASRHGGKWRKAVDFCLRYVLPSGISVALIIWFFHKVDYQKVMQIIREGCDYRWVLLMMLLTTLSHIIRGLRWGIQLRAVGVPRMGAFAESCAIFGAYALNLVFPRLGEVWRCVFVSRREGCPFMTVVGTDIGDRAADMICVIAFIALSLVVARGVIDRFMDHYAVGRTIAEIIYDPGVWAALAAVVAVVWLIMRFGNRHRGVSKLRQGLIRVWDGFKVLFTMRHTGMYLLLTAGIWFCYFMQTYVCFFAFPFTKALVSEPGTALGLIPGLMCLVFGSCSTLIPSNGGLGPWTIAVTFALTLFGINETDAAAYSLVVWGMQALMLVILGLMTAAYVMAGRRRRTRAGR